MNLILLGVFFIIIAMYFKQDSVNEIKNYDFYVFSLSWSDTYCRSKNERKDNICLNELKKLKMQNILRIHGLWPSFYKNRMNDFYCNKSSKISISESYEFPFNYMMEIWPSLGPFNNKEFWEYQYNKHGYCYTLKNEFNSYVPYFSKAVKI